MCCPNSRLWEQIQVLEPDKDGSAPTFAASMTRCLCSSSWQAAASYWWRLCSLRTDEAPSWLSSSPSTCWCKWRAGSVRCPSTPTCSTRLASATFRCAGPASPTTPSWLSDELRLRHQSIWESWILNFSGHWKGWDLNTSEYEQKYDPQFVEL